MPAPLHKRVAIRARSCTSETSNSDCRKADESRTAATDSSCQAVRLVAAQREVFAKRVALPVVGQKYAAQVWVAVEDDAHQIEGLALVPVGRAPHADHGLHVYVFLIQ